MKFRVLMLSGFLLLNARLLSVAGPISVENPRELMPATGTFVETRKDLSLSADGRWLSAAHREPRAPDEDGAGRPVIVVRDLTGQVPDRVIRTRQDRRYSRLDAPVFSPAGPFLAFVEKGRPPGNKIVSDTVIRMWDVESDSEIWESTLDTLHASWHWIAFRPDGQELFISAGAGRDYEARIYSVEAATGAHERLVLERGNAYQSAIVSRDGRFLLQCENPSETVTIWNLDRIRAKKTPRGEEKISRIAQFRGGGTFAYFIDMSPDGELVAVSGTQKAVNLWNFAPRVIAGRVLKKPAKQFRRGSQQRPILSARFSPDGRHLAVGHGDGVDLIEVSSGKKLVEFTVAEELQSIHSLVFARDGLSIIGREDTGRVLVWDLPAAVLAN